MNLSVKVLDFVQLGGAGGNRTRCLFNAIEALSQMSYSPTQRRNGARGHRSDNISDPALYRKSLFSPGGRT